MPKLGQIFAVLIWTGVLFSADRGRADVAFHLQAGGGAGLVNTGTANLAYGGHYAVDLEYLWMFSETWCLAIGASGLYGDLIFTQDGVNNRGALTGGGVSLGLASRSRGGFVMQMSGVYYPYSTFSYVNSTTSKVNDTTFKHSSLTTLTGTAPFEARLSFINENMTGQFSKHERMRTGFVFSYETQTFTQRTIQLDTNSLDNEPAERVSKDSVNFDLQAVSIRFLVGMAL